MIRHDSKEVGMMLQYNGDVASKQMHNYLRPSNRKFAPWAKHFISKAAF
jgi:hypothetical protein